MKPRLLSILSSILFFTISNAQEDAQTFEFEGNNFRWNQSTNGSLFYNEAESLPGLEVPVGEGNHSIFTATLWVAGLDENNAVKASFRRFCQANNENCYQNWGPLKVDGSSHTLAEVEQYNHIWYIRAEDIDIHTSYFNCLNDPSCDIDQEFPDYNIPADFLTWPAQGQNGFAENLAPFVDYNNDGFYTPEEGDHPAICGDFSTYTIWNDLGAEGSSTDGNEIGLEVHTSVYGYDTGVEAEFNTLFVKYKLINRGNMTLDDVHTGYWTDFDLGNSVDDYLRTDVSRKMFFVYNGEFFDSSSGAGIGYGDDLPAMGVKVLAGPKTDSNGLDDLPSFASNYGSEATGWGDGIEDNERLGLTSSQYHQGGDGPPAARTPVFAPEYHMSMKAIWRDGVPQTYGGFGWDTTSTDLIITSHCLSGDSDPLLASTNGVDPNYLVDGGWTEENEGFPAGDRRMVGSSGPFTFAPGDIQYIDLAYIFARQSYDENETEIETLQRFADEVEGRQCEPLPPIVLSDESLSIEQITKVYPNPTNDQFTIDLKLTEADRVTVDIVNVVGQVVKTIDLGNRSVGLNREYIDVNDLNEGIYFINILIGTRQGTLKVQVLR